MPRLRPSELQPGQVIAAPVTSPSGVVLMQAGTSLTAAQIARLADLGVESVVVSGAASLTPEQRAKVLADLEARFAGHERHRWMMELKDVVARLVAGTANADA